MRGSPNRGHGKEGNQLQQGVARHSSSVAMVQLKVRLEGQLGLGGGGGGGFLRHWHMLDALHCASFTLRSHAVGDLLQVEFADAKLVQLPPHLLRARSECKARGPCSGRERGSFRTAA